MKPYVQLVGGYRSQILDCYVGAAVPPGQWPHRLTLTFAVRGDGTITNPNVGMASVPDAAKQCALRRLATWSFPPTSSGYDIEVEWPFIFPIKNDIPTIWSPIDWTRVDR